MSKVWPAHRVPWTKFSTVSVRKATAKICKKATDIGHLFLLISLPKVTSVFVWNRLAHNPIVHPVGYISLLWYIFLDIECCQKSHLCSLFNHIFGGIYSVPHCQTICFSLFVNTLAIYNPPTKKCLPKPTMINKAPRISCWYAIIPSSDVKYTLQIEQRLVPKNEQIHYQIKGGP